jgi:hypothetical protein
MFSVIQITEKVIGIPYTLIQIGNENVIGKEEEI